MVKLNVITRTQQDSQRETKRDIHKVNRVVQRQDSSLGQALEYQRASNAAKIKKIFAQPFLYTLKDHTDGISCMTKANREVGRIASGSFNGEIIAWDLIGRKSYYKIDAFEGQVKDIVCQQDLRFILGAGDENKVKLYDHKISKESFLNHENIAVQKEFYTCDNLNSISLNMDQNRFLSAGEKLQFWDIEKGTCMNTMYWGCDSILQARFNPVENDVGICTGIDRGIYQFDLRTQSKLIKTFMTNKSSCIAWNPMEPFNFLAGNEDGNIYSFDMRKMEMATKIHKGHIGAVLSIDFNPTGFQFASGSYDKTIRLFNTNEGKSFEVYHSKRMQKVFSVLWSVDGKYIFSGSDETNIRAWKAQASQPVGFVTQREAQEIQYRDQLLEKFKFNKEIKRVQRTHVPKYLLTAQRKQHIQAEKKKRIMDNVKYNNEGQFQIPEPEIKRKVVNLEEQQILLLLQGWQYRGSKIVDSTFSECNSKESILSPIFRP